MLIKNVPFRHCIINNSECYYKCKLVNNCNVHGDMCRFTFKLIYLLNMCSPLTILTCILIIEEWKYIIVTNICVYCTRYIEHVVLNTTFLYLLKRIFLRFLDLKIFYLYTKIVFWENITFRHCNIFVEPVFQKDITKYKIDKTICTAKRGIQKK